MSGIERDDDPRARPSASPAFAHAERARSADERGFIESAAGRAAFAGRHDIAGAVDAGAANIRAGASSSATPMRTLESEPMPNSPPAAMNSGALKMPSPRLASVTGQSPATAPAVAIGARLGMGHMRRVNEAPALIDGRVAREAIRPGARPTRKGNPRPPSSARRHGYGSARPRQRHDVR